MYKILIKHKSIKNKEYWENHMVSDETGEPLEFGTDSLTELEAEIKKLDKTIGSENIRVISDISFEVITDVADSVDMENVTITTSEDVEDVFNTAFNKVFGGEQMKVFSEESALQLSEMLLQNDKDIKIELEEKITSIDVSGEKYDDTELVKRIEDVESSLSNKADKTELHTHTNKEVLDGITNDKITEWDAKATEIFVTNAIAQAKLDGSDVDLSGLATIEQLNGKADKTEIPDVSNLVEKEDGKGLFSGSYDDLTDKPSIPEAYDDTDLDNRIKAIEDDYVKQTDIPTTLPASDVYDWAKAETKPEYTADEVGALPDTTVIPSVEGLASKEYVNEVLTEVIGGALNVSY